MFTGQGVHVLSLIAPKALEYFPAGHIILAVPPGQYDPAGHAWQAEDPSAEVVPA